MTGLDITKRFSGTWGGCVRLCGVPQAASLNLPRPCGSSAFLVGHAAWRTRARRRLKPARPYMDRLMVSPRFTWLPSHDGPARLRQGRRHRRHRCRLGAVVHEGVAGDEPGRFWPTPRASDEERAWQHPCATGARPRTKPGMTWLTRSTHGTTPVVNISTSRQLRFTENPRVLLS